MTAVTSVKARVHSDDYRYDIPFDASRWFEQATPDEITELARCGWGGDYPGDRVAEYMADHDPRIKEMFHYIHRKQNEVRWPRQDIGFECYVDEDDAIFWIKAHVQTGDIFAIAYDLKDISVGKVLLGWLQENHPEFYFTAFCTMTSPTPM